MSGTPGPSVRADAVFEAGQTGESGETRLKMTM